jgi:hypothetical protein
VNGREHERRAILDPFAVPRALVTRLQPIHSAGGLASSCYGPL